jgi:hypothetical protein
MRPRPNHREEVPGGGGAIYYNSHATRPGIRLWHGGVFFWMVDAFKHLILSIPTSSIYKRVLFFVLRYCVVKYANILYSCCKESSRPKFRNLRQRQFFHVGINIILRTRRINTRERFFCNIWYHTGWKPVLCNAESAYGKEPWTITTVHMNGTIRIQPGTKTERLSIQRVQPFTDDIL